MKIDTLQISEDLQKAGLDSNVAKEFAHKFKFLEETLEEKQQEFLSKKEAEEKLATKLDIAEVNLKIEQAKTEIQKSINNQTKWFMGLITAYTGVIIVLQFLVQIFYTETLDTAS